MEALVKKLLLLKEEADIKSDLVSKARNRALIAVGLVFGIVAACALGYVVFSTRPSPSSFNAADGQSDVNKPDLYICSGDTEPPLDALKRAKRQRISTNPNNPPNLIKRVARPLSLPPPSVGLNFSYSPPLYHDVGARCAWGHLTNKRVPHLEDVGIAYDFQQLEARSCDDPEECKSLCLRMHKTDDPYLCNYFTWHRQKKLALFYFLEPTLKWNLTDDNRVETYFWQCREVQCAWWWRPHRVWSHLSELTPAQLRKSEGLVAVTQCTDFPTCQFSCETRPSFRELALAQKTPDSAKPEDPSCAYVVMPSKGTQNRESFLFSKPQSDLKNTTYRGSTSYDSFELICHEAEASTLFPIPTATVPAALPPLVSPGVPKPEANSTKKRQRRDTGEINFRECRLKNEQVHCSNIQSTNKDHPAQCVQLNADVFEKNPVSIKIESKRPVWLVMQQHTDSSEQTLQLTPGVQHTVDVLAQSTDQDLALKRCGPVHMRHRRCSVACNDRLAENACGCTLTPDPIQELAQFSVPLCDEERMRSCVRPYLEQASSAYFECVKECRSECDSNTMLKLKTKVSAIIDNVSNDMIEMSLSFLGASSMNSQPVNDDIDTRQFVHFWVPILVIAVLLISFILCFCAKN